MKNFRDWKILTLIFMCFLGLASVAEVNVANLPFAKVRTTAGHVNYLRGGSSNRSPILGVIPAGTPMRVFNQPRGNWWPALLELNGQRKLGWVNRSHFKQDSTAIVATTQSRRARSTGLEAGFCRNCKKSGRAQVQAQNLRNLSNIQTTLVSSNNRPHQSAILPVRGRISSRYGYRRNKATGAKRLHRGIDIAVPEGTRVVAPLDGVVVKAAGGCRTGYSKCNGYAGNTFSIQHSNGLVSTFMHLSPRCALPRVGARYNQGDALACAGNTGRSTGPHLHWGVYRNGTSIDPLSIFQRRS